VGCRSWRQYSDRRRVWADSFLHAEQQHVLLLLVWSGLSVLAGTATALLLVARHRASVLLMSFAKQLVLWGLVIAVAVVLERHGIRLRDVASATRVERLLWMRIGFDIGIVGMGTMLTIAGRRLARSQGAIGAGIAIALHGMALFIVDAQLATMVSR